MWINLSRIKIKNNYIFTNIFPENITIFRISQKFISTSPPSYRTGKIALAQWNYFGNFANQKPFLTPQITNEQLLEWKQDNKIFIFTIPSNIVFTKPRLAVIADNRYLTNVDYWVIEIDYWDQTLEIPLEGSEFIPLISGIFL